MPAKVHYIILLFQRQDVDEINDEMRKMATKFVDSVAVKFDEKNVSSLCTKAFSSLTRFYAG